MIKYDVFHNDPSKIAFTAEIDSDINESHGNKKGKAILWAIENNKSLCHLNLSHANLRDVDLSYKKFTGSNMQSCNFSYSCLVNTDFDEAYLRYSIFNKCEADYINFQKAILTNCQLKDVIMKHSILRQARFIDSNLKNANLAYTDATNVNFLNANLTRVNFDHAILTDTNLNEANLYQANMKRATFIQTKFTGVKNLLIFGPIGRAHEYGRISIDQKDNPIISIGKKKYKQKELISHIKTIYGEDYPYISIINGMCAEAINLITWKAGKKIDGIKE